MLLAIGVKFVWAGLTLSEDSVARALEKDIQTEIARIEQMLPLLEPHISGIAEEEFLPLESPYPYFIYQNGPLQFWSDYHYVPNYFEVRYINDLGLLVTRNGYYLIKKFSYMREDGLLDLAFTIPVFWSPGLENQYLRATFNERLLRNNFYTVIQDPSVFEERNIQIDGKFLFSLSFPPGFRASDPSFNILALIASLLSLIFLILFFEGLLRYYFSRAAFFKGLLFFVPAVLLIRYLMMLTNFPFHASQWELFNPRYFNAGHWIKHPADLFLHIALLLWIAWAIWRAFRHPSYWLQLRKIRTYWQAMGLMVLGFLSVLSLYGVYALNTALTQYSIWNFDITEEIKFSLLKGLGLFSTFLLGLLFFAYSHLLVKTLLLFRGKRQHYTLLILFTLIPVLVLGLVLSDGWIVFLFYASYLIVLLMSRWPLTWRKFRLNALVYSLFACMIVAAAGSTSEIKFQNEKREQEINTLANFLLADGDPYVEFLLDEVKYRIETDGFIRNRLINPFQNQEVIEQKVRRAYLKNDFDKYDVKVHLFDNQGVPLFPVSEGSNYNQWRGLVQIEGNTTPFRDIYILPERNNNSILSYFVFADLTINNGIRLGTVMLELQRKRFFPNTLVPELLVDRGRQEQSLERKYDFAVFNEGYQVYSGGLFNYPRRIRGSFIENFSSNRERKTFNDYQHYYFKRGIGKEVVVSAPVFPVNRWLGNFSFRFLLILFSIFLFVLIIGFIHYQRGGSLSYARRVQVYLNLAFFIPLIIVSISTLGRINSIFSQELEEEYFRKAQSAVTNLANAFDAFADGQIPAEELDSEILQIARLVQTDINVFGMNGRLYGVSQSSIFDNNLLSEWINPLAYRRIVEENESRALLKENIGFLSFRTVYAPIRSQSGGALLGILGMPFFDSGAELQQRQSAILTNILITFMAVFLIFFFLAYSVSNVLSFPFTYLSGKLKKISLTERNEPLEWKNEDEIGILISEYNRMLVNLEKNKKALAQSEKESAWREMAKQVAHEIKNPLTPMKLSLQQMQRTLRGVDSEENERLQRQIVALLHQVDTLSDIASSFSAFARMPTPHAELFDLVTLVKETVQLFTNDPKAQLHLHIDCDFAMIWADSKLLSRILSNLIINGIQATKEGERPILSVKLRLTDRKEVLLSIQDNGSGIPEDIRDKVFTPNFSTKTSGSGLGLAIAKHGIEHARGRIWFETSEEWGTTFYIALPLQE